jgi:hypothetical protein
MTKNIAIDSDLLERAFIVSGQATRKEEFVARRDQQRLLGLFGRLDWHPAYAYKRDRSRR